MKLDPVKLGDVFDRVDALSERIDYALSRRMDMPTIVRRGDAWDESQHPRGSDGKFVEGAGAAGAASAEYMSQQQKAGKKATPNGLMQHMLMNGGITKQEIWDATKANFEMAPHLNNYVSAVAATMKKKGIDVPEPPKQKKGGAAPAAAPMPKPPAKPLAETEALTNELADLQQKWKGMTASNKPPVDDIALKISKALGLPSGDEQSQALTKITPIDSPVGMGQKSANTFLAKVQAAAGLTPTTANAPMNMPATKSLPQGAGKKLQSEMYNDAKDAPSVYLETFGKFDGADGKIRARNVVDTDKIPEDQYAKITAAYGNDRSDAMTQAVDKAMAEYQVHSIKKLSQEDLEAVHVYQGNGYKAINDAMLSGTSGGPKNAARIKKIKAVINNSVIPCDTPVFRGMSCSLKDLSGFDDPAKSVGRAFAHKNFASVSRSAQTSSFFGDQVTLKMVLPAGTKGLVMAGQAGGEREIMLNANSVFRIDKVEQIANASGTSAKHVVHVTYMGTREDA